MEANTYLAVCMASKVAGMPAVAWRAKSGDIAASASRNVLASKPNACSKVAHLRSSGCPQEVPVDAQEINFGTCYGPWTAQCSAYELHCIVQCNSRQ